MYVQCAVQPCAVITGLAYCFTKGTDRLECIMGEGDSQDEKGKVKPLL